MRNTILHAVYALAREQGIGWLRATLDAHSAERLADLTTANLLALLPPGTVLCRHRRRIPWRAVVQVAATVGAAAAADVLNLFSQRLPWLIHAAAHLVH